MIILCWKEIKQELAAIGSKCCKTSEMKRKGLVDWTPCIPLVLIATENNDKEENCRSRFIFKFKRSVQCVKWSRRFLPGSFPNCFISSTIGTSSWFCFLFSAFYLLPFQSMLPSSYRRSSVMPCPSVISMPTLLWICQLRSTKSHHADRRKYLRHFTDRYSLSPSLNHQR